MRRPGQAAPPQQPPAADFKGDNNADHSFYDQVRDYLYHDEFDLLESVAAEARANKERVPGGYWKLALLYGGFGSPDAGVYAPDAEWQYHLGKLKKWAEENTASVTARVALGQGWDRESYERLFSEATAFEPSYPAYYQEKAAYLLPRWHGRAGE